MHPASTHNLRIVPTFYATEVGWPMWTIQSISSLQQKNNNQNWLSVDCLMSASTTLINVMEDYSTTLFIQSFVWFSCKVGYPEFLSADWWRDVSQLSRNILI